MNNKNVISKMQEFLLNYFDKNFTWSSFNCAFFVCDWIKEVKGIDPALGLRQKCKNKKDMMKILRDYGSLTKIAVDYGITLGAHPINPNFAKRGDVVLFNYRNFPTLGIMDNAGIVSPSLKGLSITPISSAILAWKL